jgi:hypothetical protein
LTQATDGTALLPSIVSGTRPVIESKDRTMSVETPPRGRATDGAAVGTPSDVVVLHRRTIDGYLTAGGAVLAIVLVVAGSLLMWGRNFATDYVHRELSAQHVSFPDEATLVKQGRQDLVGFAGQQVVGGRQAEAYASFIGGHLADVAGGQTYADLGTPDAAAKAAVQTAKDTGKDAATVAELQAKADAITTQRNTLFKGETLRGLLLSTFAWSTIGRIAGIASLVAFGAAIVMLGLVAAGFVHRRRVTGARA